MEDIKLGLVIAQMINFGIIFFLFKKFIADKLITAISDRREQLKASNEAQEQAQEKLEAATAEVEEIIADARKKATEIEGYAEELSKNNAAKAIARAENEAEHIVESGKAQVEKERLDMVSAMKSKIIDLSLKLNNKIFTKETANKDFMEKELEALTK